MLVFFARSGARSPFFPPAVGLLAGGALSNLVDRIRDGGVTDFLHIHRWPIFNLADTFIVIGVVLLLVGLAQQERQRTTDVISTTVPDDQRGARLDRFLAGLDGRRLAHRRRAPARRPAACWWTASSATSRSGCCRG